MEIYRNFLLADILYYKIGGKAAYVLTIQSEQDLFAALEFLRKEAITRVLPVGLGANLLVSDADFDGAVLWFSPQNTPGIRLERDLLHTFASVSLDQLIQFSFEHNLIGLEWAGGLPSTIGAGVRGNVGCFGKEIKDIVQSVDIVDLSKFPFVVKTIDASDMEFGYRTSRVKQDPSLLIVRATFRLEQGIKEQVENAQKIYAEKIAYRNTHHPVEYPSCGSVFKNITDKEQVEKVLTVWPDVETQVKEQWHNKVSMGYIINRLGLTGKRQGDAQISEKHANYIVNRGKASFLDVYTLIQTIQKNVENTLHFTPEPEVQIVT